MIGRKASFARLDHQDSELVIAVLDGEEDSER
jgi:hypothetical protein